MANRRRQTTMANRRRQTTTAQVVEVEEERLPMAMEMARRTVELAEVPVAGTRRLQELEAEVRRRVRVAAEERVEQISRLVALNQRKARLAPHEAESEARSRLPAVAHKT